MKSIYKEALEAERTGDWEKAHDLIQNLNTSEAAWIHAYLHRREGDDWNARYWYDLADRKYYTGSLENEWLEIWEVLIQNDSS